jgi:hypothetical protein
MATAFPVLAARWAELIVQRDPGFCEASRHLPTTLDTDGAAICAQRVWQYQYSVNRTTFSADLAVSGRTGIAMGLSSLL